MKEGNSFMQWLPPELVMDTGRPDVLRSFGTQQVRLN